MAEINEEVEAAKATLRAPIQELKAGADDVAAFMQIVVDQAGEQIAFAQAKIASFTAALEQCNNFEDVVNLIVQQVFEMLGVESDFKVEDVREGWQEVGTMIDEAIVWAEGLRDSASGGGPAPAPRRRRPCSRRRRPSRPTVAATVRAVGARTAAAVPRAVAVRAGRPAAAWARRRRRQTAAAGARSPSAAGPGAAAGGAEAQAAGAAAAGAAAAAPAGAQAAAADAAAAAGAGAAAGADAAGAAAAGAGARAAGADAVPDERRRN